MDGIEVHPTSGFDWYFGFRLGQTVVDPTFTLTTSNVPIWALALPVVGLAVWLWRIDRRIAGACQSCGYDLAGLAPNAVCPECGKGAPV